MPLFEYSCKGCNFEFEELVPAGKIENPPCPECASEATERKMSVFSGVSTSHSGLGGSSCGSNKFS